MSRLTPLTSHTPLPLLPLFSLQGLRNILAVLRTAGQTKRDNLEKSESFLIYRTLRDMNLSKLVAQDVPLFLSLLADLFPSIPPPPKGEYPQVEEALRKQVCLCFKKRRCGGAFGPR
jgi:hypothetical protein